jgi:hypothetical protein
MAGDEVDAVVDTPDEAIVGIPPRVNLDVVRGPIHRLPSFHHLPQLLDPLVLLLRRLHPQHR